MESVYLNGGYVGTTTSYLENKNTDLTSVSIISVGSVSGTTVTVPTVLDNDYFLIFSGSTDSGHVSDKPDGLVIAASTDGAGESDVGTQISYAKLSAADSSSTYTFNYYNNHYWAILRPDKDSVALFGSSNSQSTRNDPASQTISMSGVDTPVFGFASYYVNGGSFPSTSPTADYEVTVSNNFHVAAWVFNSGDTPVNATWDASDGGRNAVASCYVQFIPAVEKRYQDGIWNLQSIIESSLDDKESRYGTPYKTIRSMPSTEPGENNSSDVLVAVDAVIGSSDSGILFDIGGSGGAGFSAGVDSGTLRARAFTTTGNSAWNTDAGAAFVEVDISDYLNTFVTYYFVVDASQYKLSVYAQLGGRGSFTGLDFLGSDITDGSSSTVSGSNDCGFGTISSNVADLEASYEVDFTGLIHQIRTWQGDYQTLDLSGFGD